jgi:hypothetical protein
MLSAALALAPGFGFGSRDKKLVVECWDGWHHAVHREQVCSRLRGDSNGNSDLLHEGGY